MNKKIKLLFITNDSVTYGSSRSMLNLIDELKKKNIEIKVLIPREGPLEEELRKRNVEYKIAKYYEWIKCKDGKNKIKLHIKVFLNNFLVNPIIKWIKLENFDIIHSINSAVCIGGYITKKIKIIHVWHIRELMEEDHNLEFFNFNKTVKILNSANKLIYVSKSVENKYKNLFEENKGVLIYNGIPSENYNNVRLINKKNIFKILIAGNICKTKGQEEAIKAIEKLKNKGTENIELNIAGDGELEEELKIYVKEKGLEKQVKFLGFRNDLDEIRKEINIYLMCSRNEAFGRVTVEAMMSKNLLIGANTGGTLEIIQDKENGLLYNQGDYSDLADKIEFAINNWDKCIEIIENAYKDAMNRFTIKRCAEEIENVYKNLLEGE